ncbi:extracellular solute-binding protein [Paenibacillus roseipurpureus]|uniref:Extracellular solute-binding protein n=1 Tax=Paenibacillus roseopurpureus TaxID=2918901 RepID=A0AA96LRJ4_9BACL|nr:extracellular solute-binding protein [Paenibacillus sp. MBLB1832]WNR45998.1 extracellular solute-binding protein [Paenibacillus sp. MBLB1832]
MKKSLAILSALTITSIMLAACGGGNSTPAKDKKDSGQASQAPVDANKKYKIRAMNILYGTAGPETGTGKKAIEDRYNIDFEYIPVASGEYTNKLGVTLASGDIPDLVLFPQLDAIYFNAINSGQFLPIETYMNDAKNYPNLAKLPKDVTDTLKLNGHIYGVPRLRALPGPSITLRKDWMDKLGLKVPTNYDELYNVLKAFKEKDPDGNGKDDTFGVSMGVGADGALIGVGSLTASFRSGAGFGSNVWVEDGKGGIVLADIGPNAKPSLTFLAKLYKDGLIAKDFAVKKDQQVKDDFLLGKTGAISWAYNAYDPTNTINKAKAANPNWSVISVPPIKAMDGSEGGYIKDTGYFGIFGINKDVAKDPGKLARVLKMLDDQIGDDGANFIKWGVEGVHYKNENGKKTETDVGSKEGPIKYKLTDHAAEGDWIYIASDTDESKKYRMEAFDNALKGKPWSKQDTGLYSKTYAEKGKELLKQIYDAEVKIIMGEAPVDSFDKAIADFNSKGGDLITKEMNDAWKARK